MKIAVASDQAFVASGFGCCPFCTIFEVENGRIRSSLLIPNPGGSHLFWADLFERNSIEFVIAGAMGSTARSVLLGHGIHPVLGISGPIQDAVRRFLAGELGPESGQESVQSAAPVCCGCGS